MLNQRSNISLFVFIYALFACGTIRGKPGSIEGGDFLLRGGSLFHLDHIEDGALFAVELAELIVHFKTDLVPASCFGRFFDRTGSD